MNLIFKVFVSVLIFYSISSVNANKYYEKACAGKSVGETWKSSKRHMGFCCPPAPVKCKCYTQNYANSCHLRSDWRDVCKYFGKEHHPDSKVKDYAHNGCTTAPSNCGAGGSYCKHTIKHTNRDY